jgi:hypothetical protein
MQQEQGWRLERRHYKIKLSISVGTPRAALLRRMRKKPSSPAAI